MAAVKAQAILIHADDNVATTFKPVPAGRSITLKAGDRTVTVTLREPIPSGHKFSVAPIAPGDRIVKYGESIGTATAAIEAGRHVHVQNVQSCRGRGDLDPAQKQ
jgi:altronate dehydratase small subunit